MQATYQVCFLPCLFFDRLFNIYELLLSDKYVTDILEQATTYGQTVVECLHDLVIDGKEIGTREVFDPEADDEEFRLDPLSPIAYHEISFQRKQEIVQYWKDGDKRKKYGRKSLNRRKAPKSAGKPPPKYKNIQTVQNKYSEVRDRRQLYR